jgi:hypothetical protein
MAGVFGCWKTQEDATGLAPKHRISLTYGFAMLKSMRAI